MQRWGKSTAGKTRWFCKICVKSHVAKRTDTANYWFKHLFKAWLTGSATLNGIAKRKSCTRQTLAIRFAAFWRDMPQPSYPQSLGDTYLVVDAVYLAGHHECVLIGRTGQGHVFWLFAEQETFVAWHAFLSKLPKPMAVICDGQSGLLSVLKTLWPDVPVQRCLAHIQRLGIQKLTRHPHTPAGQELLALVYGLTGSKAILAKNAWIAAFQDWGARWQTFLKERTYGEYPSGKRSWWYTHRRIRALKRTLEQGLQNLFAFMDWPGIPATTNLVEGGINSRLKELLHRHRGMNLEHKKTLVAHFLNSRNAPQKPTRNFT